MTPAGPELNALNREVAEKVMGCTVESGVTYHDGRGIPWTVFRKDGTTHNSIPYSTDLLAAMEVVAEMQRQRFEVEAEWRLIGEQWRVAFIMTGITYREYGATADTLPLAICRAALAAVSPTDKQE